MTDKDYVIFLKKAMNNDDIKPYPFQEKLATKPWPELLDILNYGQDIDVLAPKSLRAKTLEHLRLAAALYEE